MSYKSIKEIVSGSGISFDPADPRFVRYSSEAGYLGRILLTPGIQLHAGNERLQGTPINLLGPIATSAHISWLSNEIRANTGVKLRAITGKSFQDVSVDDLLALGSITATRLPAPGPEHVFAVKMGEPYLAKVRLYVPSGQSLMHAEWVTYDVQSSKIIGEGYNNPQDLALGQESTEFGSGEYAYVTDWDAGAGVWELVKVQGEHGNFDKGFFDILADGTGRPGQIALTQTDVFVVDESRVYMAPRNGETSAKVIVDGLAGACGLLVQRDLVNPQDITLYVLANSGGGWTLRSRELDLGGALPVAASSMTMLASGSGTGGFLSFGFEEPSVISFPRTNENKLVRVDLPETLGAGSAIDIPVATAGQTPLGMRSLCAGSATTVFIASAGELGSNDFQLVTADLVMGIGFVPFTSIIDTGVNIGRADTMTDTPGYFFQVRNVPFGGGIHLMLNHRQARLNGAEFYQVTLGSVTADDNFDDFIWDKTIGKWVIRTTAVEVAGGGRKAYRLRKLDADLWYNPYRSCIINTRKVPDGLHLLTVTFLNAAGNPVAGVGAGGSRTLLIDNTNSTAKLDLPILNAQAQALTCGCLRYGTRSESFEIGYVATHPRNEALYHLQVYRGNQLLSAPISDIGVPVPNAGPKMLTVGDVLGDCNVVNVRVSVYVPLRITNGHGWAYTGAEAHRHFTLVPSSIDLDRK